MRKYRKAAAVLLVLQLLLCSAAGVAEKTAESDRTSTGVTTFGMASVKAYPRISFSVPLYVTLAVVGDKVGQTTRVYAPAAGNYQITNLSTGKIGVTGLKVSTVANNTWALTGNTAPSTVSQMKLSLGGVVLPQLTSGEASVPLTTEADVGLYHSGSAFANSNGKPKAIATTGDDSKLSLQFAGSVIPQWYETGTELAATPQWSVSYTLTQVDDAGNEIVAYTYSGNARRFVWDGTQFTTEGAFKD